MSNILPKKGFVFFVTCLSVLSLFATSCNSGSSEYTQELKNQVSALETQNALLLENKNAISSSSEENGVEAPQPPPDESNSQVSFTTPIPESLPIDLVSAGSPIVYDGWAITMSKELIINSWNSDFGISIHVRNLGNTNRVFRFSNAGIIVSDNLGNFYNPSNEGAGIGEDCEASYHIVKNLQVRAGEIEEISSQRYGYNSCEEVDGINMFEGPIPLEATQLIIHIDDFGPFNDVSVYIRL